MACRSVSSSVPVVLRVKRKREEEPADALVLAKIPKIDPSLNKADNPEVFHLVSTVHHHHQTSQQVLDHISHHRQHSSLVKLTSFSGLSISKQQEERRQARKALTSTRRFKLVSKLRSLETPDPVELPPSSPTKELHQTDSVDPWIGNVRLYDLESEPAESGEIGSKSNSQACKESEAAHRGHDASSCTDNGKRSTISCNSSPLVRESVRGAGDYVYDLYYTQSCSLQDMMTCNWDNLCAHSYDSEIVHDLLDSDEEQCYDDEDDSNDEGNWRNDYPDESNSDENSSCDGDVLHYRSAEAYLGDEDENGYLDESYWNKN